MAGRKGAAAQITRLKGGVVRSPKGIARYAYVSRPDDSAYGKDRYRITLVMDKEDPEFVPFAKKIIALAKLHAAEIGKSTKPAIPIKLVDEKMSKGKDGKGGTGDPIGAPYIQFEANSKFERGGVEQEVIIPTFNAAGVEESVLIYGGDICKVQARVAGWLLNGDHGVKCYLNAVQLLQSNWSGGAGSLFEAEDEYLKDSDEDETDELADELEDDDDSFENEEDGEPVSDIDAEEIGKPSDTDDDDPLAGLI